MSALESPLGPGIRKHQSAFAKASDVIAVTLLWYRFASKDDFWIPFIETLPKTLTSLLMWRENEIACLGNRSLQYRMNKKISVLATRFTSILNVLGDILPPGTEADFSSWFTLDNFKWAHACIASRSIYYDGTRAIAQKSHVLGRISFPKGASNLSIQRKGKM
jgi:hypothetical protein